MGGELLSSGCPVDAPFPVDPNREDIIGWGYAQQRVNPGDVGPWLNWLWAWQNPQPDKEIVGLRFEPKAGTVVLSAISAGRASSLPAPMGDAPEGAVDAICGNPV